MGEMRIATVTPHRGRVKALEHHLRSLVNQTRPPDLSVVVSHGDTLEDRRAIVGVMGRTLDGGYIPKQFWSAADEGVPWAKPLAVNWGVRRVPSTVDIVISIDVDCIFHPLTLERLEKEFEIRPSCFVMCPNLSLPEGAVPDDRPWTFEELRAHGRLVRWRGHREDIGPMSHGVGALQAAPREWWHRVRGLDEEMALWGSEDIDLAKRAARTGLSWRWIPMPLASLHQWHEAAQISDAPEIVARLKKNHEISVTKLRRGQFVRNGRGWGGLPT